MDSTGQPTVPQSDACVSTLFTLEPDTQSMSEKIGLQLLHRPALQAAWGFIPLRIIMLELMLTFSDYRSGNSPGATSLTGLFRAYL